MTKLNIGIAPYEEMKRWTMAVAAGRIKPGPNAPTLWFTSLKAAANVFSEANRQLLRIISEEHPQSIADLERFSHRRASNLSRTLKKLEQYGVVRLTQGEPGKGRKPLRPEVLVDSVNLTLTII